MFKTMIEAVSHTVSKRGHVFDTHPAYSRHSYVFNSIIKLQENPQSRTHIHIHHNKLQTAEREREWRGRRTT